jgi:hypothetical protein
MIMACSALSRTLLALMDQPVTEKELITALRDCSRYVSLLPTKEESSVIQSKVTNILTRWLVQQSKDENVCIKLYKEISSGGPIEQEAKKALKKHFENKRRS